MAAQKKTLNIQPFRQINNMDATAARAKWEELSSAIDEIYNQNASRLAFEAVYRCAYNLVMQKHGDLLYEGLKENLTQHLRKSLAAIIATENALLLEVVVREWNAHKISFGMIKDILMYMDRSYCTTRKKPMVMDVAMQLFREVLIGPATAQRLRVVVLEKIALERAGYIVDRDALKVVIGMLLSLSRGPTTAYHEELEDFFLVESQLFYQHESLHLLSSNPCPEYLRKAEARLAEEADRLAAYIPSVTEARLRKILDTELITQHAQLLLDMESGLVSMLRDDKIEDLRRLYILFNRVPACVDLLREQTGKYIVACGMDILSSQDGSKDPVSFVKMVLDLKFKYDVIIQQAFRNEKKMLKQLKDSFESFVNKDHRCASSLASYLDELLRSNGQSTSEEEVDVRLDQAVTIFKFLADKDIFENFYRKALCKRLLSNKSSSDEIEKSVIARLKAECGYQFTSKLEGMLLDMNISKNAMEGFHPSSSGCELEVTLLTTGYWPMTPSNSCRMPAPLMQGMAAFRAFYAEKNSGRKLSWMTNAGSVDIKANFPEGKRDFNLSVYQACMLLLFNEQDVWSLEEIAQRTEIPELELKQHLLSLCTPKLKVLCKASKGKGIEEGDQFRFNIDFTSKFKRIKVPLIALKEVMPMEEESAGDALPAQVEEDRRHLVEATIVRVMKSRKNLSHLDLVAEVTRQLSNRFVPSPQFIKRRIESLIERDYLQRHSEDSRLYNYLA